MKTPQAKPSQTTRDEFNAPWSLRFEQDGTEDVAVISDADGDELLHSRPFWLPEGDDPQSPTLATIQLIRVAPDLLAACRMIVARWEHGDLAEAARACQAAVEAATGDGPPWDVTQTQRPRAMPYSVLLLYPDYANDGGTETYYAFVHAGDAIAAVAQARRKAAAAQGGVEINPEDFAPLLVTPGHHRGEPLFNL